jgi:hypothetical protein
MELEDGVVASTTVVSAKSFRFVVTGKEAAPLQFRANLDHGEAEACVRRADVDNGFSECVSLKAGNGCAAVDVPPAVVATGVWLVDVVRRGDRSILVHVVATLGSAVRLAQGMLWNDAFVEVADDAPRLSRKFRVFVGGLVRVVVEPALRVVGRFEDDTVEANAVREAEEKKFVWGKDSDAPSDDVGLRTVLQPPHLRLAAGAWLEFRVSAERAVQFTIGVETPSGRLELGSTPLLEDSYGWFRRYSFTATAGARLHVQPCFGQVQVRLGSEKDLKDAKKATPKRGALYDLPSGGEVYAEVLPAGVPGPVVYEIGVVEPGWVPSALGFVGCFRRASDDVGDFVEQPLSGSGHTVAACGEACQDYTYFALQSRGECRCGNTYGKFGKLADGACGDPCDWESGGRCGTRWAEAVYMPATPLIDRGALKAPGNALFAGNFSSPPTLVLFPRDSRYAPTACAARIALDDPRVEKHGLVKGERYVPQMQGPVNAVLLLDGQVGPLAELELSAYSTSRGSFFLVVVLAIVVAGVMYMRSQQTKAAKWKVELAGDSYLNDPMMSGFGGSGGYGYGDELRPRMYQELNDNGGFGSSRTFY